MNVAARFRIVSMLAVAQAFCATALADEWRYTMSTYVLGAGIDGETQVGPVTADIDYSFGDILENLDLGLMGAYRAENDRLAWTADLMYTSSSAEDVAPGGIRYKAELDQIIASVDLAYRFDERVEFLGGFRYNSLDADVGAFPPGGAAIRRGDSQDWVDPYIGARATLPFNESLSLILRGDVGGFDVGSDLAWQVVARLEWRLARSLLASAGYRILDTDYEDGSGASLFRYDVAMSGVLVGFGWQF